MPPIDPPAPSSIPHRPHVVVVLCDDLGFGDVGALSAPGRREHPDRPSVPTPALDAMAADGVVLEGMYCPAPVCAPSRASLLTGTTQGHCRLRDNDFDAELEDTATLAAVLRHAGYATAAIGKWGLPGQPPDGVEPGPAVWPGYPTRRGFDEFFGYVRHADGHEHYPKEGLYRGSKQVWWNDREVSADLDRCYTTDLFTARAKQWIVERNRAEPERPFFLYLALDTPHAVQELPTGPYPAGGGLNGGMLWTGRAGEMIATADGEPDSWVHPDHRDAKLPDGTPWPEVYRRYATAVRRIDDAVGDLRALLSDLGIAEETLVLFTSDNGPSIESYLDEPLRADFLGSYGPFDGIKRDCWEGGLRVGALATWPAVVAAGSRRSEPVQFHDLLPTLAEAAGVRPPARCDGVSLLPLLSGVGEQLASTVYVEYAGPGRTPPYGDFAAGRGDRLRGQMQMLRIGDHVGVRYDVRTGDEPFEIYDVRADPGQRDDLAGRRPELQRSLTTAARRRRAPHPGVPRPYDHQPMPALAADETHPPTRRRIAAAVPGSDGWLALPAPHDLTAGDQPSDAAGGALTVGEGVLEIDDTGCHRLEVGLGGLHGVEVVLRLHDTVVIDGAPRPDRPGCVQLAAGRHPYRVVVGAATEVAVSAAPCPTHPPD